MEQCIYCGNELLFPWEQRRFDCDECHYSFNVTYHEHDHDEEVENKVGS